MASSACGLLAKSDSKKAARGTDGRTYPWGDDPPNCILGNFKNCVGGITPVGSYPEGASPYGALDMAGNVSEWVADFYSPYYYRVSPYENPTGPETSHEISWGSGLGLLRGGNFNDSGLQLTAWFRGAGHSHNRFVSNRGFRCVFEVD
jgi:formylglycine-generating enzyme required for sulfatase activity